MFLDSIFSEDIFDSRFFKSNKMLEMTEKRTNFLSILKIICATFYKCGTPVILNDIIKINFSFSQLFQNLNFTFINRINKKLSV